MLFTNIKQFQSQFEAKKETDPQLSNDILLVKQDTLEELDPNEWEIEKIVDVLTDLKTIKKIEENIENSKTNGKLEYFKIRLEVFEKDLAEKPEIFNDYALKYFYTSEIAFMKKYIEENDTLLENSGSNVSMDLTVKDVKIGQKIYLTALLKPKNKSTAYAIGEMGVIAARVTDVFYGLNKLNQLQKAGKLLK